MRRNCSQTLDKFVEGSKASPLFFFVSFYLMNLHIFTFPMQRLSDFSTNDIPLRKKLAGFLWLFYWVCFLFFCFSYLVFFCVHQIVNAPLEFWMFAGQTPPGVLLFMQMFTGLKLTHDSLWSSVLSLLFATLLGPATSVSQRAAGGRTQPCDHQT